MLNLLRDANSQSINSKEGHQPFPSTGYSEFPITSINYESSTFSEDAYQAETYLSKNRSMRNQEWLDEMETITRAQVGDFRFSVEALANEMALSRSQLFRKVKELLSIGPNQFIREIRLEVAKELLESGQVTSIKTTAYKVGLKDVANFSKMFKEKFGFLPSDFI